MEGFTGMFFYNLQSFVIANVVKQSKRIKRIFPDSRSTEYVYYCLTSKF